MESLPLCFKLIGVQKGQKVPTSKGWGHEASDEYISSLDVKTRMNSEDNYGVLCGHRSGIIVIDYDTDKIPDCEVNLESLKKNHGDTLIVQTPKGGFHVYHAYEPRYNHWNGITGIEGFIDVRTNGNYVVGPGSMVNGKVYTIVNQAKCLPMPDEIYGAFDSAMCKLQQHSKSILEPGKYDMLLNEKGFTNIRWVNSYDFDCDQRGRGRICPLCDRMHENNHYFLSEYKGAIFLKNHSHKCKRICLIKSEEDNYETMKNKIDKDVFKVLNPLCYCIHRTNELQICSLNQLREIYSTNILYDEKKKEYNFFDRWTKDTTKKEVEKMDFLPEPLVCPINVYNLWGGFKYEDNVGDIDKFISLMNLVDGGSEYMIHYLAHLIQKPGEMPLVGIVLRGIEGSGKNSITEIMKRLVGDEHYFSTSDPGRDVFCRFSEAINKKLVINFDEAEAKKMFMFNEDIKCLITSRTTNYEKKGITPICMRSFVRCIVTTNNYTPLKISLTDRRWAVFNVLDTYVKNKKFWDEMYAWIDDADNIGFIYNYLKNIDLLGVNLKDIPETSALNEMKQACLPIEIKWITEFIHEYHVVTIKNSDLFESYKNFMPSKIEVDIRTFGLMMKKLNIDGFTKTRDMYGITWCINHTMAKQWLTNKGVDQSGF